jgi:hypothetical protein
MAQKNRANMLTDIVSNIYNNLINFITGQNAQDRFVNLLDSSPNILSDASQANGYVSTDANNEMFSSYYDEEISRADLISDLTANLAVGGKFYRINDAVGTTITLLVTAESNINLYPFGIDATTGEIGTYDITTDVFTVIAGSGNANITTISAAALLALPSFSTTTIYVVTDAPLRISIQAETTSQLGQTATVIDDAYSGVVDYDLATNTFLNGTIYDGNGNTWNGLMPQGTTIPIFNTTINNTFYPLADNNVLNEDSNNNIFEQGASGNTLDKYAIGNTFKQGANSFIFYQYLKNTTIEAGVTGADYTATPDYDFLYNNAYSATIFTDGTDNYHRYYDPANDRIVVTLMTSPFTVSYIGGGAGSGTVTSVGLSMPSAFSVASSPVTTSGTIAVTGAGLVSQYVRGDGSLANFPSSGGGGASVNYYLNGSVSQGTFGGVAMKEINKTPIIGTGTDFTIAADGYIQSFITDANDPNQLVIPAGNWNFETYFSASSGGGSPSFYIELHKWDGTTLTLIASNSATPEAITGGTTIDLYLSAIAVPQTTLALTDRLAIRIYVTHSGRTITLHTENSHLCEVTTTFTTGLTALNGLTEQVQNLAVGTSGTDFAISSASSTHTFNLPTASASNRGALSSADWTAFNSKVSASSTDTLTNKRITARSGTVASAATPTINTDNVDYYSITALAAAITSFTTNLSGTPTTGQTLWISIKDNGTARAIAWGASFEASTIALPTTTVISTRLDVAFIWNEATSVWRCVGVA